MRAAAVYPVLVPSPRVHKRLDEQPERVRLVQFEPLEQIPERLGFAAAFHQIFQLVTDFCAEKSLHVLEVNEVTDRAHLPADLEQVADGSAIGVAAGQWSEILETQFTVRLLDDGKDDVGGVQSLVGRDVFHRAPSLL